jgi:hypothetical protein
VVANHRPPSARASHMGLIWERGTSNSMKAERLAINSQCTFQWNLEEALDAYAPAGFRNVEPHLLTDVALGCGVMDLESRCMGTRGSRDEPRRR